MNVSIHEHELFHQYKPTVESELYQAMMAELQVRSQRDYAWQVLRDRTHELRNLLSQLNSIGSDTAEEEVPLVQARAEGMRWLIKRIEQEIRDLEAAYELKARKVLALVGQVEEQWVLRGLRMGSGSFEDSGWAVGPSRTQDGQ